MNTLCSGDIVMISKSMGARLYDVTPASADKPALLEDVQQDVGVSCIAMVLGWANDDYVMVLCSTLNTIGFVWKEYVEALHPR